MEIPVWQTQTDAGFDFDAMPMVSSAVEIPGPVSGTDVPIAEMYFANLAAVAQFRVFSSSSLYAGETVSAVSFEAASPLAGPFTADISGMDTGVPESLAISGYSETCVTTTVSPALPCGASESDSEACVFMVLAPGTYTGTLTVTTNLAEYRFAVGSPQTFRRAVLRTLDVDLARCQDRRSTVSSNPVTVTKTLPQIFSGMGIAPANAEKYEILRLDDVITIETNGYNNCGKYYTSGATWRVYAADYGNVKIKAAPGYELQSVTMVYTSQAGTGNVYPTFDGPGSGKAQAVSGCSVTYHVGNALGHLRFTKFSVTYIESSYTAPRGYLDGYEVPELSMTVAASGLETFGDDGGAPARWIEFDLPEISRRVVTHTFEYMGKVRRNYTTMVDRDRRCPLWVAYPMHGTAYANNGVDRVGSFYEKHSYDPAIPASWQSSGSTKDGSSSSPYSRGHLCASEDRQVTDDSNRQTFYYTNQAPQWQNSFNSGVWSSLETAVQNKAGQLTARDTMYVVSGTLFDGNVYGDSNDGGQVARPSHFYKLLMLCGFDSSGAMTSARGAAYLYENVAHTGAVYSSAVYHTTIDAIEERAGFNFFANVPEGLQEAAESAFSSLL